VWVVLWLRAHLLRGFRGVVVWETEKIWPYTKRNLTFVKNKRLEKYREVFY